MSEPCSIIEKTVGLQEPLRLALEPLAGKICLALIYGSIAKQSDTAASDIDLSLRAHGYRSDSRYLVFQCLQHTLQLPNEQWRVLDQAHRKRNIAEYEGDIEVDEQLLEALIRVADEVAERVSKMEKSIK